MASKAEIARMFLHLDAGFPHCKLPVESRDAYAEDLEDLDADVLMHAARRLRRSVKFYPAISEIRELCEPIMAERARRRAMAEYRPRLDAPPDQNDPRIIECKRRLREITSRSAQWPN